MLRIDVSSRGQVALAKAGREELGLGEGTALTWLIPAEA